MHVDGVDLAKPEADMSLEELKVKFAHMMRNTALEHCRAIQDMGPLSDDDFIRLRQELYRRIVAKESGVVSSAEPGGIMHHPV